MQTIDISQFHKDDSFYPHLDLVITVKSFDLQAIRRRYIASRKNKSGKAGSVERRKVSTGGVVSLSLEKGNLINPEVLLRTKEPRGIDVQDNKLAVATEDIVYVHDGKSDYVLTHPWFSYIHTVRFSPHDPNRILVVSSGLDMLLEVDFKTKEIEFEWLAWENNWDTAHDPKSNEEIKLTRSPEMAKKYEEEGINFKLINNPRGQVLPTAMRAAFINSVAYDPNDEDILYATFFHEGAVFKLDQKTGLTEKVLGDLQNPHGGFPLATSIFATSTSSGEVVIKGNNGTIQRIDFSQLPGKAEGLGKLEWLQNSIAIDENRFLTIDSNRNQFIVFDIVAEKYDAIPYDDDWAIQDIVVHSLTRKEKNWLSSIVTH